MERPATAEQCTLTPINYIVAELKRSPALWLPIAAVSGCACRAVNGSACARDFLHNSTTVPRELCPRYELILVKARTHYL